MDEIQEAIRTETDERKRAKLEKKLAKLAKFLSKAKIVAVPKKERKKIEFTEGEVLAPGEKKRVEKLEGQFNPLQVENGWFSWWESQGFFTPEYQQKKNNGQVFTIVLPPPNVTGSLHIGHAMMSAIEDVLVRMKRMQGYKTLFLPGTDHAGIATQVVVEKCLAKEGVSRQDLGRDKFLERVWAWKEAYGHQIVSQFRRLGTSLDFTREKFTMDPELSAAVTEAFVQFYEQGLIYRGSRLVNWCAKIQTTLSDLEVDYAEVQPFEKIKTDGGEYAFGRLFTVRYEIEKEGKIQGSVEVSTTRPETIFGDAALCANPSDERYTAFAGSFAVNPLTNKRIPFVLDEAAEIGFGTGVLKITPAHDLVDFAVGEKHGLETVSVLDENNRMTVGPFKGELRFEAREKTAALLKDLGRLVREEGHEGRVPLCSRTGEVVEPRVLPQWWMRCEGLAKQALEASETGNLEIVPEEMKKTWSAWLSGIRDWCLSRQLWWGHRIPAYTANNKWYVARSREEAEKQAGCPVVQEEDVLDTWFSSGLWPFATLGWPNQTEDIKTHYPTTLLETGKDIIFFWVARMVMMGLALTGTLPFKTVLMHSIVRDARGEKMSKSKGNVIDPVDVISGTTLKSLIERLHSGNLSEEEVKKATKALSEEYPQGIEACGSDALRFSLLASASLGRDVNLSIEKVSSCRRFCNKVWNGAKFALAQQPQESAKASALAASTDRWIESKLSETVETVTSALESYNFMKAATEIQQFWVGDFCDFYLEMFKGRKDAAGVATLRKVARTYMVLAHPLLPFLTEEIYQAMKHQWSGTDPKKEKGLEVEPKPEVDWAESITVEGYPEPGPRHKDSEAIEGVIELIRGVRSHASALASFQGVEIESSPETLALEESPEMLSRLLATRIEFKTEIKKITDISGKIKFFIAE
ncbi:valyl-tRNA synthetase [Nematocida displodere]|uniref:valine--tRNA ligase n=1 Tax=Nematocida displodere TaxID=1805483 RepID=A0A177ECM8_9MICR|nr:valyl-tRNA synthetase [Nematocida displodere]